MTDLIDRLEALGRDAAPDLDDARMHLIEARVMETTREAPGGRRRPALVVAVAAAILLLVAGVVFASGGDGTVRLEVADGVVLERPGDDPVAATSGDELSDGTVVVVRPGGAAVVGGDRYGPGRYLVFDGALVAVPPPATSSTTTTEPRSPRSSPGDVDDVAATTRPRATRTTPPAPASTTSSPVERDTAPDVATSPPRRRNPSTTEVMRDRPTTTTQRDRPTTTTPPATTTPASDRTTVPRTTRPATTVAPRSTTTSANATTTLPDRDGRDRP